MTSRTIRGPAGVGERPISTDRYGRGMPEIARFYGIVITLNFGDRLPPHVHARYGGSHAAITFDGRVLSGRLPPRALALVRAWTHLHTLELHEDWDLARAGRPVRPIEPLE